MECPPTHAEYGSQMLADNAVTLHRLMYPDCPGFHAFPCGEHYHVGHPRPRYGDACKDDPGHNASRRRVKRAIANIREWR